MSYGVAEDEERGQTPVKEALPVRTRSLPTPTIRRKNLFEDSLLETSRGQRGRRAWTTLFSMTVQCLLVGILILVPLLYTEVLPKEQVVTMLVAPPPPPPPAAPRTPIKEVRVVSDIVNGQLRTPTRIPNKVLMIKEAEVPPPASPGGVVGGVPGGIPGGQLGGVIGGILSSLSRPVAVPKPVAIPQRVRVSQGVTRGLLIRQVQPTYPVLAKEARIQGQVVLTAIIAKDGTIQKLQVVSGHPMLVPAAINAVKQWRYKPYLLSGQPVEVVTTITVNFNLGG
jgi:periplasmic protein TonB